MAAMCLVVGCGDAIERSAREWKIPREDARDIIRSLRAEKHPHVIYRFSRTPTGIIYASTGVGDFLVEGTRGKWKFTELVFYSSPRHTSNQAQKRIAADNEIVSCH